MLDIVETVSSVETVLRVLYNSFEASKVWLKDRSCHDVHAFLSQKNLEIKLNLKTLEFRQCWTLWRQCCVYYTIVSSHRKFDWKIDRATSRTRFFHRKTWKLNYKSWKLANFDNVGHSGDSVACIMFRAIERSFEMLWNFGKSSPRRKTVPLTKKNKLLILIFIFQKRTDSKFFPPEYLCFFCHNSSDCINSKYPTKERNFNFNFNGYSSRLLSLVIN